MATHFPVRYGMSGPALGSGQIHPPQGPPTEPQINICRQRRNNREALSQAPARALNWLLHFELSAFDEALEAVLTQIK